MTTLDNTSQNKMEVFTLEDNDYELFVKIGDGLIARACKECRHPQKECLCYIKRSEEHTARLAEKVKFIATLPRKMTKEEIYANPHTHSEARGLFEFGGEWEGAVVMKKKDNPYSIAFRRIPKK